MKNIFKIGLAAMAFGIFAVHPAHAQTTIIADNFSGASLGDPTSQSGTASPTTYTAFGTASSPAVASGSGHVAMGNGDTGFSPNYNFASAGVNPLTASFDFTFTTVNSATRWLSFTIGSPTEIVKASGANSNSPADYSSVYATGNNGCLIQFIADSNLSGIRVANGAAPPTLVGPTFAYSSSDTYDALVTFDPTSYAYGLTLTDMTSGTVLVTPSVVGGIVALPSATANYMNFGAHSTPGTFSNFSVTAAPEPSDIVALLVGALGICGLALYARSRGSSAA